MIARNRESIHGLIQNWKALIEDNRNIGGSDLFIDQEEMLEMLTYLEKFMWVAYAAKAYRRNLTEQVSADDYAKRVTEELDAALASI